VLEVAAEVRRASDIPIFLLGYYNPFFRYGLGRVAADARTAGVDGLLCVDLPPEEADELQNETHKSGVDLIFMLAPTSSPSRVRRVLARSRGLVYCVSVTGITGARASLPQSLRSMVEGIRAAQPKRTGSGALPLAVGFGVSTPEQAAWVGGFADGVIVGSAIAQIIERHLGQPDPSTGLRTELVAQVGAFVSDLKRATEAGKRSAA
jgi:tryptophan synthase alpha chain